MSSAARRLWRDRTAVAFGALFLLLALAFFAAPLYASEVAEMTFAENRLSEQITLDGEPLHRLARGRSDMAGATRSSSARGRFC